MPAVRKIGEISYYNCGDWVEHCTALVEHLDGRIALVGVEGREVPAVALDRGPRRPGALEPDEPAVHYG
jgi:hypothetical protein